MAGMIVGICVVWEGLKIQRAMEAIKRFHLHLDKLALGRRKNAFPEHFSSNLPKRMRDVVISL